MVMSEKPQDNPPEPPIDKPDPTDPVKVAQFLLSTFFP
jgi:hypothetical protein